MTWLEVIDTTVKIGFGAIVGGFFAFLLNRQQHKNELSKLAFVERLKILKESGVTFEKIHLKLVAIAFEYYDVLEKYLRDLEQGNTMAPDQNQRTTEFIQEKRNLISSVVKDLYPLQGILMINNFTDMSAVIHEYTATIGELLQYDPQKDIDAITESLKILQTLRMNFYDSAQKYYNI